MIKKMILLSAAAVMLNASGADAPEAARPAPAETEKKDAVIQAEVTSRTARIQSLTAQRAELIGKQKKKRQELLRTNPRLRRMYQQILKQTRQLALEMDSNREMNSLNERLQTVEKEIRQEQTELNKLKKQKKANDGSFR